jgi:hypothetical protein
MKKFWKKVAEWGVVGLLVTLGMTAAGVDPITSRAAGAAMESASDAAIERHVEE